MMMTDFLITEMSLYPWFTWLLVFFAAMGIGYAGIWAWKVQLTVYAWLGYRRQVWLAKAAVRRQLLENPERSCAVCNDRDALLLEAMAAGDDPPGYQHPDGGDDGFDWDGPPDDWSPALAWGPGPVPHDTRTDMAGLAEVLKKAAAMGLLDDDQPDEMERTLRANDLAELGISERLPRCNNRDCYAYGCMHDGACDLAQTQPAACYADGPAMPPQPVREYLHPAIMDDLEAAGFSEHETTDGAVDSMFTRAQAKEVIAQITDGIIPTGDEG